MLSRVLSRLRMLLPALALFILLGDSAPKTAFARNRYELADRCEGDPGDGVLDPAIDGNDTPSSGRNRDLIAATSGGVWTNAWVLPLGDLYLVPVQVPGSLPGHGTVFFLPRLWLRAGATVPRFEGGWHDAP